MQQNQIDELLDIVAQKATIERPLLTPESRLADLNIASLDMVEILFALEDRLGIEMSFNANTNVGQFKTINDLIILVDQEIAKKA